MTEETREIIRKQVKLAKEYGFSELYVVLPIGEAEILIRLPDPRSEKITHQ